MARPEVRRALETVRPTAHLSVAGFLDALFAALKGAEPGYGWKRFSEDLGFGPTNQGRLLARGARAPKASTARRVADALDLRGTERAYFLELAALGNAVVAHAKERGRGRLLSLQEKAAGADSEAFRIRYFSSWLVPAARELLRVAGPDGATPEDLARIARLRVATRDAAAALEVLDELGFTSADGGPDGRRTLRGEEAVVMPANAAVGALAALRYHESMLEVSKRALAELPDDERDFNALTVTVSREVDALVRAKIAELFEEILALEALPQEREVVRQVNLQTFRLAAKPPREDSDAS